MFIPPIVFSRRFSKLGKKLPETAKLLQVCEVRTSTLTEQFLEYDFACKEGYITSEQFRQHAQPTMLILLFQCDNGHFFTAIRAGLKENRDYYKEMSGLKFQVVVKGKKVRTRYLREKYHVGKTVLYEPLGTQKKEVGTISSWNKDFIFVKFKSGVPRATNPEYLSFCEV